MSLPSLNWADLIIALIATVLGWLGNIINPAPGTARKSSMRK